MSLRRIHRRLTIQELEPRIAPAGAFWEHAVFAGDSYSVDDRDIPLFRLTDHVALALEAPEQAEDVLNSLTAEGAVLDDFSNKSLITDTMALIWGGPGTTLAGLNTMLSQVQNVSGVAWAAPVFLNAESGLRQVATNEMVVALKPGFEAAGFLDVLYGGYRPVPGTPDQFVVAVPGAVGPSILPQVNQIRLDPRVAWAEPNFWNEIDFQLVPDDPLYYPYQWHLDNTGQSGAKPDADVNAPEAWDITPGDPNIVIAIIDSGVQRNHPDLAANIWVNPGEIPNNGEDDDGNGYIDDINGWNVFLNNNAVDPSGSHSNEHHGTAVAGVAAAVGNNATGVTGIAFNARIMPIKISSGASFGTAVQLANAVYYAAGRNSAGTGVWDAADVINCSWTTSATETLSTAFLYAHDQGRLGRGMPIFAASGNSASGYRYFSTGVTEGDWIFEWRFTKNPGGGTAGDGTAWIADVFFPGGTEGSPINYEERFDSPQLPPGWTAPGLNGWSVVDDPSHAYGTGRYEAKAGIIADGEVSALRSPVIHVEGSGLHTMFFFGWLSADSNDTLSLWGSSDGGATFSSLLSTSISGPSSASIPSVTYPANLATTIAVGASTDWDYRSDYSQYGLDLDFVAPSGGGFADITTTDRTGSAGYVSGDYFSGFSGTSSASPLAAGVGALLLSANPLLTPEEIRSIMRRTAHKIGLVEYSGEGFNPYYGYGRIDAFAALQEIISRPPTGLTLAAASDTGVSSSDRITMLDNSSPPVALQFVVDGTVGGAELRLYTTAGVLIGGPVLGAAGQTVITTDGVIDLADGPNAFVARQTEPGKPESGPSPVLVITVDTVPPNAPGTPDLAPGSDTGASNSDNLTNDNTPTFNLSGVAGNYWRMFRSGLQASGDYETGGTFTEPSPINDGVYDYELQNFDVAGNASPRSGALSVTIETVPPSVVNTSPSDGTAFRTLPSYEVFFSEAMDTGTIQAGDLQLTGPGLGTLAVTSCTIVSPSQVRFNISGTPDNGAVIFTLAPGSMADLAGNPLLADARTLYADTIGPTVVSTDPAQGDLLYQLPEYIVNFSEPINTATLQASDLLISGPGAGTLAPTSVSMLDADTARFVISGTPTYGINSLTLSIPAGALTDSVGNLFQGDVRVFTMDTVSPRVQNTTPANGAIISTLAQYIVDFSDPINPASVQNSDLQITNAPGGSLSVIGTSVASNIVTFNLSGALGNGLVTFAIAAGAILDFEGYGCWADVRSFTADTIPPSIVSTFPTNGAYINSLPEYLITFSEAIDPTTVQTTDLVLSGSGLAGLTITSGAVVGGNTLRFGFSGSLTDGPGTFTLNLGAVSDLAGNTSPRDVRNVTVDVTPPAVATTTPANGALVSSLRNYVVDFTETIDPLSVQALDLSLSGPGLGSLFVSGVSMDDADTVRFFLAGTPGNGVISLTLQQGAVTDLAGNPSPRDVRTVTADTIPPAVVSASPSNGSRFRALAQYLVGFSEPIDPATVQPTDLSLSGPGIGGLSVTGATVLGGNSVGFSLAGVPGNGGVTFGLAAGSINDLAGNGMAAFSNTLIADTLNPTVASTEPPEGGVISLIPYYLVNFSEAIDPATVQVGDLLLGGPGLGTLTVSDVIIVDEDTVRFIMSGTAGTGLITADLPAGAVADLVGNPLDAHSRNLLGPVRKELVSGTPSSFFDQTGRLITLSLSGPGSGIYTLANGLDTGAPPGWIVLDGTTPATSLKISSKSGVTTIDYIVINAAFPGAALGSLSAKGVSVNDQGGIQANGGIKSITLGNVGANVQFIIGGSVNSISVGTVGSNFVLDMTGKLGTFTAASVAAGSAITTTDSITSIKTTQGGLFATVTAADSIGSISVASGGLNGNIFAFGAGGIGSIKVTGGHSGLIQALMGGIKSVQVLGGPLNTTINARGDVGTVDVNGPGGLLSIVSQGNVKSVTSKSPKGIISVITGGIDAQTLGAFSGATTDLNAFTFRTPGGMGSVTARDMTNVVAFTRSVNSFTAKRDLTASLLVAGYDIGYGQPIGGEPYGSGNIKSVTVGRNMTQSSISAGVDPGPNAVFGGSNKVFVHGQWLSSDDFSVKQLSMKGEIGSVKVGGRIVGSAAYNNYAIEAAGRIGSVSDSTRTVLNPIEVLFGDVIIRAFL